MTEITVKRKKKRSLRPASPALAIFLVLALAAGLFSFFSYLNCQPPYEPLSAEAVDAIRAAAPTESEPREAVVKAGLTLLGRVHYFWGGKSDALEWDADWGQPREVTSQGSDSTGSTKPYGLDCSGFVAWCYAQLGLSPTEVEEAVGHGTWNQWDRSISIRWKELRVGDWVFQNKYPTNKGNHIGICIGFDTAGKPLFLHCASSFDNVVVSGAGDIFRYARRPMVYDMLEAGESPIPTPTA
ncbi:MAG: NlpC/P60 family protein [Candidatus Pelethousia sp.]|nr:NlpC/P60 family protein [Candidatus Pelethousia sp.]